MTSYTVLIVDDSKPVRMITKSALLKYDESISVVEAEDGQIGVDKAREIKPDLIITDIMMPNLDGIGLLQQIANEFHIIAVTGHPKSIEKARVAGAKECFTKPLTESQISDYINSIR